MPIPTTSNASSDPGSASASKHAPALSSPLSSTQPGSSQTDKDAALNPGTIKINVQGAFIVDDESPAASSPPSPPEGIKEVVETNGFDYKHDTSDIRLPNQSTLVSHIAVDIGGSLAKLVFFSPEPSSPSSGGRLNFVKFETADRIDECMDRMATLQEIHRSRNGASAGELGVVATGGGAFKYYDEIKRKLGVEVLCEDEMECLIVGLDFFIQEIPREVFTHNPTVFQPPRTALYPYLLVNIGSGVSMIKVTSPQTFTRVGGTSLGGGTLWGLLSILTGARNFDDMLALADKGDNKAVDMLVGDIYGQGTGYAKIGLKSDTIASSFGKVYKMKREAEKEAEDGGGLANGDRHLALDRMPTNPESGHAEGALDSSRNDAITFKPEDVSRSLLYAVSYNIGQIAYLQSTIHQLPHIYFGGSFIRGHRQTMDTLSYAIRYWSKGEKQAYFLRHEGYLGAVGAFLKRQPRNWGRRNSFDGVAGKFAHQAAQEEEPIGERQ